jgi:hypothetical protein
MLKVKGWTMVHQANRSQNRDGVIKWVLHKTDFKSKTVARIGDAVQ